LAALEVRADALLEAGPLSVYQETLGASGALHVAVARLTNPHGRRPTERTRVAHPTRVSGLGTAVVLAAELDADLEVIGVVGARCARTTLVVREVACLLKVEHGGDTGVPALRDGLT